MGVLQIESLAFYIFSKHIAFRMISSDMTPNNMIKFLVFFFFLMALLPSKPVEFIEK